MKFLINGVEWEIEELDSDDSMMLVNGQKCAGTTHYFHQQIFLSKTLKKDRKFSTLCHELSHAFLYETQLQDKDKFNEEELCNFVGNYAKQILEIANRYFSND